ncbi:MAG: DUF3810 domain-containing protein [Bacteroidales bacterium]
MGNNMAAKWKIRVPIIVMGFSLALFLLFKLLPEFMDRVYSGFIYRYLAQAMSGVMSLIPFSIAEILIYALVFFLIFYAGKALIRKKWKTFLRNLGITALYAVSIFMLTCGLNYHRVPLEEHLGYRVEPTPKEDLLALAADITERANLAASFTGRDLKGKMIPDYTFEGIKKAVASAYDSLASVTGLKVGGTFPSVKPVMASRGMSYAFVMGFFFPWTVEANINNDVPAFWIPALIAHEQAHVRGFMRENEANFLTYLLAGYTQNRELKYSCLLHSLNYVLNAVYKVDPIDYEEIIDGLSPRILYDLDQNRAYWEPFRTSFARVSQQMNDVYLKANGQKEGVGSYGKVVDLMIAHHKNNQETMQQNPGHSVYIGESTQ